MKIRHILLSILLFVSSLHAAAETLSLSMGECRRMALENNGRVKSARWLGAQADAEVANYRANFLPHFDLNAAAMVSTADGSYTTPDLMLPVYLGAQPAAPAGFAAIPSMTVDYDLHTAWGAALSMTQPLYMGGKIKAGYDIAKRSRELSRLNIAKTADEVAIEADMAYINVIKCLQLRRVAEAYCELLDNLKRNVESANRAGMKTRNDIARVNVAVGEGRLACAKAENAYRLAAMNLCHVAGLPLDTKIEAVDTIVPAVTGAEGDWSIAGRPEYDMTRLQTEVAALKVKAARAEALPSAGINVSYGVLSGGKIGDYKVFDNKFGLSAMVTLKVPLFSWGQHSAKIRSARAAMESAAAEETRLREQMELDAMQCHNRLDEAVLEASIAADNLAAAEENLRVSDLMYAAGSATLNDHLEATLLWVQAREKVVDTHCAARMARLRYLRATGQPLDQ